MAGETVLVIEDNEMNIELVECLLQIRGNQILKAGDAETGIEKARRHKPDLILMDIQLPGMDGLSATRLLKQDGDLKEIPVVALTSYAMQGDDEKALEAGCTGYIAKPINTRTFLDTLEKYMA